MNFVIPKFLMKNLPYIIILLLIIIVLLAFQSFLDQTREGLTSYTDTIPLDNGASPNIGYYNVSDTTQAKLPSIGEASPFPENNIKPPDGYFETTINGIKYLTPAVFSLSSYKNPPEGFYRVNSYYMASYPAPGRTSILPDTSIRGIDIPNGFYIVDVNGVNMLAQVPYGYQATPDNMGIVPKGTVVTGNTSANNRSSSYATKYNYNNYDVTYHDTIEDLIKQGSLGFGDGSAIVYDNNGNAISLPGIKKPDTPTFYQPGSFIFGSTNYVPNYEDSVFLSRTTGLSQVANNYSKASASAGFCYANKNFPSKLEQKCNALDNEVCGSVSCCVTLGGQKCVSGDIKGPYMTANYTDPFIKNKDFYYYQGKCYGNCP
jgi:hypothetical protein